MTILIADDDPTSREVLAALCRKSGEHQVALAENGEQAWALLDDPKRWFDVVFLDVSMPKVSGLDLLERLHGSQLHRSLEVVMCTAANDRATITQAIGFGARHYLVKPCTEPMVNAKLQLIQQKRDGGQAPRKTG